MSESIWLIPVYSDKAKPHLFLESPFNPRYFRSACGLLYGRNRLGDPTEQEMNRPCKKCQKRAMKS